VAPGFDLGYTIAMRRWLPPLAAALAIGAAACGADERARLQLHTPPERAGTEPLPQVRAAQERAEKALERAKAHRTKADARRARPVLSRWARALRRDGGDRAAAFFAVPAIVAQGVAIRLETEADVMRFHISLPCGARLLDLGRQGRYFIATFRMTARPGHVCSTVGDRFKVAVVLQGRKITEWRQVPETPGASPLPAQPEDAPPPPPKRIA
jgi:hypothetical protein